MIPALLFILIALAYSLAQSVYWGYRVWTRQVFVFPPLPKIDDELPEFPPRRVVAISDEIPY